MLERDEDGGNTYSSTRFKNTEHGCKKCFDKVRTRVISEKRLRLLTALQGGFDWVSGGALVLQGGS